MQGEIKTISLLWTNFTCTYKMDTGLYHYRWQHAYVVCLSIQVDICYIVFNIWVLAVLHILSSEGLGISLV